MIVVTPSMDDDVALAVDLLVQRGLRPVVVLIEAASFGGVTGSRELSHAIRGAGVPVCQVGNGDDLSTVLSLESDAPRGRVGSLSRSRITHQMVRG